MWFETKWNAYTMLNDNRCSYAYIYFTCNHLKNLHKYVNLYFNRYVRCPFSIAHAFPSIYERKHVCTRIWFHFNANNNLQSSTATKKNRKKKIRTPNRIVRYSPVWRFVFLKAQANETRLRFDLLCAEIKYLRRFDANKKTSNKR